MAKLIIELNDEDGREFGVLMCIRGWLFQTIERQFDEAHRICVGRYMADEPTIWMAEQDDYEFMDAGRLLLRRARMLEALRNAVVVESGGAL